VAVRSDKPGNVNTCTTELDTFSVRGIAVTIALWVYLVNMSDETAALQSPIIVRWRSIPIHHGVKLVPKVQQPMADELRCTSIWAKSAMVAFNASSIE
jgi:hypothetical protein